MTTFLDFFCPPHHKLSKCQFSEVAIICLLDVDEVTSTNGAMDTAYLLVIN